MMWGSVIQPPSLFLPKLPKAREAHSPFPPWTAQPGVAWSWRPRSHCICLVSILPGVVEVPPQVKQDLWAMELREEEG